MPRPLDDHAAIDRLRAFKAPRDRNLSMSADLRSSLMHFRRQRRGVGACADAWQAIIPPDLAARTRLEALQRDVLTVVAEDAATRFAIDRLLRAGAESAIIRRCPVGLKRIKLVLGSAPSAPASKPRA